MIEVDDETDLHFLIAVGYPAETPQYDDIPADAPTAYYLDGNDVLHVPKITAEEITTIK